MTTADGEETIPGPLEFLSCKFFADVCATLDGIQEVLVTGSHTAIPDFRHYADKHRPQTAARIVHYEEVDHPSENQLVALARACFLKHSPCCCRLCQRLCGRPADLLGPVRRVLAASPWPLRSVAAAERTRALVRHAIAPSPGTGAAEAAAHWACP